jgi:RNase P protein component
VGALTHNKSYRKGSSCVKISVTEGGKGDTTQHNRIRRRIKEAVFSSIKRREG